MLNGLDLFSGIGGLSIALRPWVVPVAYCENDRYAQAVLLSRMADTRITHAPIWDDVRTLRGEYLPTVNIIYGGFPCQDISVAGNGGGLEGKRSGLFFEIVRLVEETRPAFIFLENVPAIRTRGLARVCFELARLGYDLRWTTVSAAEVGAPHLRKRWFLLAAHSERIGIRDESGRGSRSNGKSAPKSFHNGPKESVAHSKIIGRERGRGGGRAAPDREREGRESLGMGEVVADRDREGLEVREQGDAGKFETPFGRSWWESEPDVDRVVNGLPYRVDRIKCLGNSVVPLQAREAFKRLAGIEVRGES